MNVQASVTTIDECRKFLSSLNDSREKTQELYQNYAEIYDKMMDAGYKTPDVLGRMCMNHLKSNSSKTLLLDIASGTGLMAQALKRWGFKGVIDGIEANSKMIEECIKKDILYRDIKEHFLSEDHPMPYSDNTYDVIICASALSLGHIPHQCIQDMIRILKPEGLLLFNVTRNITDYDNIAVSAVEDFMKRMMSENRCKLIQKVAETSFENTHFCMPKPFFHCYMKIK